MSSWNDNVITEFRESKGVTESLGPEADHHAHDRREVR